MAAVGLVAAWVPLLALSDYWVTSPSQDTAALILCVAAAAYLADAVGRRVAWAADAATACVAAISVSLIRPTLGAFTVGVILGSGVLAARRGRLRRPTVVVASVNVAVMGVAAVIATLARDIILSGWLLFPLSTFPVPVDWRAPDPVLASGNSRLPPRPGEPVAVHGGVELGWIVDPASPAVMGDLRVCPPGLTAVISSSPPSDGRTFAFAALGSP